MCMTKIMTWLLAAGVVTVAAAQQGTTTPSSAATATRAEVKPPTAKEIAHMHTLMSDWAQLARYRDEDGKLPPPRGW
jgi:hypothetical protein